MVHLVHPVHRGDENGLGQCLGQLDVQSRGSRPAAGDLYTIGQTWRVEAHLHIDRVEDRAEHRASAHLVLALGGLAIGDLLAVELETRQLIGGAGDDNGAATVADGQRGRLNGTDILGELVEERLDALGVDIGHRHHRGAVTAHHNAAAARDQGGRRTHELGDGQQLDIAIAVRLERLNGEHALRVPDDGDRRKLGHIQALDLQRTDGGQLGQQHTGHGDRGRGQLGGGGHRLLSGQRTHPGERCEADRAHHHEFLGDGLQAQLGLAGKGGELRFDTGRGRQLRE